MRALVASIVLAGFAGFTAVADEGRIDGLWKYSGGDAAFEVRLRRDGSCSVNGAVDNGGVLVRCSYEIHGPFVDIHWLDGHAEPVQLVLVGHGQLLRFPGEAKRPLHRVWNVPADPPKPVDLRKPGALAALEASDPAAYKKVLELVDLIQNHGCLGVWLGQLRALVDADMVGCGAMNHPPSKSIVGFKIGEARYLIEIPPK